MLGCNAEKRSIRLDLKQKEGRQIYYDLVEHADVIIENMRPGTADRLGIGYDDVSSITPDIIYCSISGYGETSPWSQRPAYDPILQGVTGLMSVTGPAGGPPVKVGTAIIDIVTGIWSVVAVQSALLARLGSGEGGYIDMSMFDVGISLLTKQMSVWQIENRIPEPLGTHDMWVIPYGGYPTKDDEFVIVGTATQKLWKKLCRLIGRDDLIADERFLDRPDRLEHRTELNEILNAEFKKKTRTEWLEILQGEIPVGPILNVPEAINTEQGEESEVLGSVEHEAYGRIDVLNLPLRTKTSRHQFESPPPVLGEHSETILREIGYSESEIQNLVEHDVI